MIHIDIEADLNMVDDDDRNFARLPSSVPLAIGDVAVAGRPGFWSWVKIEELSATSVYFRQITAAEAATHGTAVMTARVSPLVPSRHGEGHRPSTTSNERRR